MGVSMAAHTLVHYTESWPIAVSCIYGQEHSEEALSAAYATWTEYLLRGPHVLIVDMTQGNAGSTAPQRARTAEWLEQNESLLREGRQLAHVLVFDSALVRGIVTAVFWLRRPVAPHHVAPNRIEAIEIAVSTLAGAGIRVTPAQIELARRAGLTAGLSPDTVGKS